MKKQANAIFFLILQSSLTKKPSRDGRYDKRQSSTQPPKVIDVKIEKVELHQTENAWKPTKFAEAANGDQVSFLS